MISKYDDIINLKRPVSLKHKPMSLYDRAAQFSPFAALTGYEDKVSESGRIVGDRIELTEEQKVILDGKLSDISMGDMISITYFVPDKNKDGGKYTNYKGIIRRIDQVERIIEFKDHQKFSIDLLIDIDRI